MHKVTVENGVRLAVQDLNPGGRHTILFVHGWPLTHEIFEYQFDVLPKYDIRCIAYDLRGYGASDRPFSGYSYDRMADDLYKVIQSINCKSLTLLGFSMGGAICCRYMARHKGFKVNKLVLCGAAAPSFVKTEKSPYGMTKDQVDQLIEEAYTDRQEMCAQFGELCFATKISNSYRHWFTQTSWNAAGYATIKGLEALREENLFGDLPKIHVPTMILHGKKDKVCPFPFAIEMNRAIRNSFIVPFENSSHALFYDEADKFNSSLLGFVKNEENC